MLKTRILRATMSMPSGDQVFLNEELDIRVRIKKNVLALQNRASIVVFGMTRPLREQLLSQFTAWNNRKVQQGQPSQKWVKIKIEAGYTDENGVELSAIVFLGEVALVSLADSPPDIGVEITAYSRQADKTSFITTQPPSKGTLEFFTKWAAEQLELGSNWICDTKYAKLVLENAFIGFQTRAALVWALQDTRKPDVVAYIDDDFLVVKDRNKVINPSDIIPLSEFVSVPSWDEYGVSFEVLFDTSIRVATGVNLTSLMNPSVNGTYVVTELGYDLTSREGPFNITGYGSPPA